MTDIFITPFSPIKLGTLTIWASGPLGQGGGSRQSQGVHSTGIRYTSQTHSVTQQAAWPKGIRSGANPSPTRSSAMTPSTIAPSPTIAMAAATLISTTAPSFRLPQNYSHRHLLDVHPGHRRILLDIVDNIEWVSLIFYNCLHNLVPPLVIDLLHTIKCHSFSCR